MPVHALESQNLEALGSILGFVSPRPVSMRYSVAGDVRTARELGSTPEVRGNVGRWSCSLSCKYHFLDDWPGAVCSASTFTSSGPVSFRNRLGVTRLLTFCDEVTTWMYTP